MEQAKRALVRRWLDQSGGMARNTENLPTHRSKMINLYAVDPRTALDPGSVLLVCQRTEVCRAACRAGYAGSTKIEIRSIHDGRSQL